LIAYVGILIGQKAADKIGRCDHIPLRYRKVPHLTREDFMWVFWWNKDENKNNDYPKWLIPLKQKR
jgi:hypothetical protein